VRAGAVRGAEYGLSWIVMPSRPTKTVKRRPCHICGRVTLHTVTAVRSGSGRVLAAPSDGREHRTWTDGRIDVRQVNGDWITVRPARQ
jgi:hypothetical protein